MTRLLQRRLEAYALEPQDARAIFQLLNEISRDDRSLLEPRHLTIAFKAYAELKEPEAALELFNDAQSDILGGFGVYEAFVTVLLQSWSDSRLPDVISKIKLADQPKASTLIRLITELYVNRGELEVARAFLAALAEPLELIEQSKQ